MLDVDSDSWGVEAADIEGFFEEFGDRLPKQLVDQLGELKQRLSA